MSTDNQSIWAEAPEITGFKNLAMPRPDVIELPSGVTFHVLRQGQVGVCRLVCLIPGGLAEASVPVLPQLLLSMVQEGTARHPGVELAKTIEFNGATVQVGIYQHYMLIGITTLSSKALEVIPLLHEMLFSPELDEVPFASCLERQIQNVELMEKRVEYHVAKTMASLMMGPSHPLARRQSPAKISRLTTSDLKQWHRYTCGSPVGMHLFLAGDVTDELTAHVEQLFGTSAGAGTTGLELNVLPFVAAPPQRVNVSVADAVQSAVRISAPSIPRSNPDYLDLRLLVMALGGYFGSRLMLNIREDKGYTYGISASLIGSPEGSVIEIASSTDAANVDSLIREVMTEISGASARVFTDDETERLKSYATTQLASMLDTPFDIMDYYITLQASFIDTADYYSRQYEAIKKMSSEKLTALARKYLSAEAFTTVVAG